MPAIRLMLSLKQIAYQPHSNGNGSVMVVEGFLLDVLVKMVTEQAVKYMSL